MVVSETIKDVKIDYLLMNFLPSWWLKNYGIEYGKKMYFDPDYRTEMYVKMRKHFYERFGCKIGAGEADPQAIVIPPDFDNTFYQNMLGFDVQYFADQYPMGEGHMEAEPMMELKVPEDLWKEYPYTEVKKQVEYLNEKLGQNAPLILQTRGVLNEAIQICSTDFYCDLLDEDYEEETDHVMQYVTDIIKQQIAWNVKQKPDFMHVLMNCTCGIAGRPTYESRVFKYDWQLYEFCKEQGAKIGLHHCGNFDRFHDIYARLEGLDFVEIGHESQIKPVLEKFPNSHVQYILSTKLMNFGTPDQIHAEAKRILEESEGHWDHFSVKSSNIDFAPDENVLAFVEAFR